MTVPSDRLKQLVADARPGVFWTDRPDAPGANPGLANRIVADLVIIGGRFTGLWTALHAAQADPGRGIVLLEGEVCGFGASSRNGGFCDASLTHGLFNGLAHWPEDSATLIAMGDENLEGIVRTCEEFGIEAGIERTGSLEVAVTSWQIDGLVAAQAIAAGHGVHLELLDKDAVQAEVASPTFLHGLWDRTGVVMVDPARLTWGLKRAATDHSVRIFENSRAISVNRDGAELRVETSTGSVTTPKVIMATNAWAEPERSARRYIIPIYDHVLMTEPLSTAQSAAIGWENRQGLTDSGYRFHYYRLTEDNRILWGGYDANYYRGAGMGPEYESRMESYVLLAGHFFETFPQLEGLGFGHRWAGPIGGTSRFSVAFGKRHRGDLVWVGGYTGLGVGACRWAGAVALDLVDGQDTDRTRLQMVLKKPFPFPPEPLRNPLVQFTRRQIAKADVNGIRGPWLRFLDRMGVGFDS